MTVITSYSIHYTKLYDNANRCRFGVCSPSSAGVSPTTLITTVDCIQLPLRLRIAAELQAAMILRVVNIVATLQFLLNGAVQFNDPDSLRSVAIGGAATLIAGLA